MSPHSRFLGFLTAIWMLAAAPFGYGQDGYPPGLEIRPPTATAPSSPFPPASPARDLGELVAPPRFESARPPSPWYADGEMAVLFNGAVHFNEQFAVVEGDTRAVYLSPRVFLGRRLDGGGSVRFTYRNLTELGHTGYAEESGGDWSAERTFTTNWFDLDYVSREYAPLSWWRVQWEAGGRFVFRHYGSRGRSSYARHDSSDNYFGGGPHLGLTSRWLLGQSGWAAYGRADTAVTFGGSEATFRYRPLRTDMWGQAEAPRSERSSRSECQFDLGLQLGLVRRWEWRGRALGMGVGVQADVLSVGNLSGEFNAFGLVNVGPFLRCEIGF